MSTGPVNIKFSCGLTPSDPEEKPVLFIGQASHLASLTWDDVKCKLEPTVTETVWAKALSHTVSHPGESCEAYPRSVSVTSLPARRSRHAAPSRPHAVAKAMRTVYRSTDQYVVLVVRKRDVLPSCVALSRSLPLFSARTGPQPLAVGSPTKQNKTLHVEILLVPEDKEDGDSEDEDQHQIDPYLLEPGLSDEDLRMISTVSAEVRRAAMLADMPTNMADVDRFIQEACAVAKELDIAAPTIIRGEELKEKGMGGLYGVGKAASCPPALVVLSYSCAGATDTVAWVGKGIVYDTGGLSIKARTSMVGMKGDCAGAAGVLGAFAVAVRASPTVNLHAVLCMAENSVGPLSTRPDDIHTLYSGRTVEINNTDAEGRLVLSDGVVYAQRDLKANIIVDMATLTGAQGIATGQHHAAVVCNRSRLERRAVQAGRAAGEPAHPLPYAPELHYPEFSSALADMKNSVADRNNAQSSCAGLFMLAHLGFDFPGDWLHIDMAAPATCGERATGYGVSLLSVLFGRYTRNELLKALSPR